MVILQVTRPSCGERHKKFGISTICSIWRSLRALQVPRHMCNHPRGPRPPGITQTWGARTNARFFSGAEIADDGELRDDGDLRRRVSPGGELRQQVAGGSTGGSAGEGKGRARGVLRSSGTESTIFAIRGVTHE